MRISDWSSDVCSSDLVKKASVALRAALHHLSLMASSLDPSSRGKVILVGAGPGDPGLLTLRAVDALRAADVVVHDGLIDPRVRDSRHPCAPRISVATHRSTPTLSPEATHTPLVTRKNCLEGKW